MNERPLEMEYIPTAEPDRAVLVGLEPLRGEGRRSMQELMDLAKAAGAVPVGLLVQKRDTPDVRTFIGRGKLEELRSEVLTTGADLVVFNDELTATQARNLARRIEAEVRILDRTELILDIFAQHARSAEGKLQVELAQLMYAQARLTGRGRSMSRIGGGAAGGGVGTRGPGEMKLDVDRRRIRGRIAELRRRLRDVSGRRDVERRHRQQTGVPTVSLVGYTNAGKSSLLNALSGRPVASAHDRLFETLDPIVRRVGIGEGYEALISDTVGFIKDLPHPLVAAFHATLQEVVEADLIVEVLDASDPYLERQHEATSAVLGELGATGKPSLAVLNKLDLVDEARAEELAGLFPEALTVSAVTGAGLDPLREALRERLFGRLVSLTLELPYRELAVLDLLHQRGHVISADYGPEAVKAQVRVDEELLGQVREYVVAE